MTVSTPPPSATQAPQGRPAPAYSAFGLVGELGIIIAAPVALLGFGGAELDKSLHTGHWLLLSAFVLSFCISAYSVWKIVKRLESR